VAILMGRNWPELTPQEFYNDVLKPGQFLPIKIATIATRVRRHLEERGLERNERIRRVTSVVVEDAMRRAKLYNANGLAALLFPNGDLKAELVPTQANDSRFASYMTHYGLVDRDWLSIAAHAFHMRAAQADVPQTRVHSLAYWLKNKLYLNMYDGSMMRMQVVDKRAVYAERVAVGTDGVLLLRASSSSDTKYTPWSIAEEDLGWITPGSMKLTEGSLIDETILSSVNYEGDPAKYRQIIKIWFLSLFFATEMKSKPILMFEGTGGGGKSSIGVGIGSMLIGAGFVMNNAPTTGKEVGEKMSGTPLVVWDEWDSPSKEVENQVKTLTTGGQDSRRQLYETSKVVELSCDAAVIAATNSNPIRQAGGARRFIVEPVAPRESKGNDEVYQSMGGHLIPSRAAKRDAMWKEMLGDLAQCMISMANTPADTKTVFSMADFGVFFQRCANHEGWGDEARDLMRWIVAQQENQQADTRVILNLLTERLRQQPALIGKYMTATAWTAELQEAIPDHDHDLRRRVTRNFFLYEVKTFRNLFVDRLGMAFKDDSHAKTEHYAFSPNCLTAPTPITVANCYGNESDEKAVA
jgi:hypothetical protein